MCKMSISILNQDEPSVECLVGHLRKSSKKNHEDSITVKNSAKNDLYFISKNNLEISN